MRRVMERAATRSKYAGSHRFWSPTPRERSSSQRGADAKPASNSVNGAAASRRTACAESDAH
jgi:hypothetical protein